MLVVIHTIIPFHAIYVQLLSWPWCVIMLFVIIVDARPTSQIHLDNASLKLRDYMDALESMKVPMRAPDLSPDDAEYWKQRRAALKAEHEKFAAEFELRERHEGKEGTQSIRMATLRRCFTHC